MHAKWGVKGCWFLVECLDHSDVFIPCRPQSENSHFSFRKPKKNHSQKAHHRITMKFSLVLLIGLDGISPLLPLQQIHSQVCSIPPWIHCTPHSLSLSFYSMCSLLTKGARRRMWTLQNCFTIHFAWHQSRTKRAHQGRDRHRIHRNLWWQGRLTGNSRRKEEVRRFCLEIQRPFDWGTHDSGFELQEQGRNEVCLYVRVCKSGQVNGSGASFVVQEFKA